MNKKIIFTSFFLLLLLFFSLVFIRSISIFLIDIFLAIVLAYSFRNVFFGFSSKFGRQKASVFTLLTIIFTIMLPAALVVILITAEIKSGIFYFNIKFPDVQTSILNSSVFQKVMSTEFLSERVMIFEFIKSDGITDIIASWGMEILRFLQQTVFNITVFIWHMLFVVLILFYMIRDGETFIRVLKENLPLEPADISAVIDEFSNIFDAVVKGTFIVALIEGLLGGILFRIFGIPSPVLWATIMMFFSMIPIVGANFIIVPASIIIMLTGDVFKGVLLLIIGGSIITLSQTFFKPRLVGNKSGIHPLVILLSTIGTIGWIGPAGFIIGPVSAALFITLWKLFSKKILHKTHEDIF